MTTAGYSSAYRQANRNRDWVKNCLKSVYTQIRTRRGKKGLPFNIAFHDLEALLLDQGNVCAVSGLEFRMPEGVCSPYSMSVDRVNPELGYVKGNLRIVLHGINSLKLNGTDEDVLAICRAVVEKNK